VPGPALAMPIVHPRGRPGAERAVFFSVRPRTDQSGWAVAIQARLDLRQARRRPRWRSRRGPNCHSPRLRQPPRHWRCSTGRRQRWRRRRWQCWPGRRRPPHSRPMPGSSRVGCASRHKWSRSHLRPRWWRRRSSLRPHWRHSPQSRSRFGRRWHQQQRHHLIAKIPRFCRWRASRNGRRVMAAAVKLREVASPRF